MKSSVKVGSLLGIPVEINYTWLVIFGLVTWTLAISYFPVYSPDFTQTQYWIAATTSSILLFVSLLLHEFSHSFIAQRNNIPIKKITLFIFGGVAQMEKEPDTSEVELKIAIAGPLCSLTISLIAFAMSGLLQYFKVNSLVLGVFKYIALMNATLVVFNSIPGFPLDGGRVLRASIWYFNKNLKSATRIATTCGKLFSFLFMTAGLLYLFFANYITGIWFLVIGLFLHEAAELSYQQLILKKALVGTPVRDVMIKDVITVPPDLKLDVLVNDYFFKHRHMGFPVVENGKLLGIVTLQCVKEIPNDQWPTTEVRKALIDVRQDLIVCPDNDALDALMQVTKTGLGRLLVVDNGQLLGIIVQRDLVKLFEIKTHLCR